VLVNSVWTSLPMFILSFLEIPKGVQKRLNFFGLVYSGRVTNINANIDSQGVEHHMLTQRSRWYRVEVLDIKNICFI
jgi:hypothetical protein